MIDFARFGIIDVLTDDSIIHRKPGIEEGIQHLSTQTKRYIVEQIEDTHGCIIIAEWNHALNYFIPPEYKREKSFGFWPGEMSLNEAARKYLLGELQCIEEVVCECGCSDFHMSSFANEITLVCKKCNESMVFENEKA